MPDLSLKPPHYRVRPYPRKPLRSASSRGRSGRLAPVARSPRRSGPKATRRSRTTPDGRGPGVAAHLVLAALREGELQPASSRASRAEHAARPRAAPARRRASRRGASAAGRRRARDPRPPPRRRAGSRSADGGGGWRAAPSSVRSSSALGVVVESAHREDAGATCGMRSRTTGRPPGSRAARHVAARLVEEHVACAPPRPRAAGRRP